MGILGCFKWVLMGFETCFSGFAVGINWFLSWFLVSEDMVDFILWAQFLYFFCLICA